MNYRLIQVRDGVVRTPCGTDGGFPTWRDASPKDKEIVDAVNHVEQKTIVPYNVIDREAYPFGLVTLRNGYYLVMEVLDGWRVTPRLPDLAALRQKPKTAHAPATTMERP